MMEEPTTTTLPGVRIAGGVSRWRRPHFALIIDLFFIDRNEVCRDEIYLCCFSFVRARSQAFFATPPASLGGDDDGSLRPFGRARQ